MGNFTADDQLLLSSLIYFEDVVDRGDQTVKNIVEHIKERGVEKYIENGELPGAMDTSEWILLFDAILARDDLCSLRLSHSVNNNNGYPDQFRAATFVSEPVSDPSDAIIVFRGTANSIDQWSDNVEGAFEFDTDHQKYAKHYADDVLKDFSQDTNVMVTGHSKGGNQAAYVTTLDETGKIDHCTTFDAQGFSDLFFKKYHDAIEKNQSKITAIVAQEDKVSLLLSSVAEQEICYKTEYQDDPMMFHKFNLLIGEMTVDKQVERTDKDKQIKKYLDDLSEDVEGWPPALQNLVSESIGEMLVNKKIGHANLTMLIIALVGEIEIQGFLHRDVEGLMNIIPEIATIFLLINSDENETPFVSVIMDLCEKYLLLDKVSRGISSGFYKQAMRVFNEWFRKLTNVQIHGGSTGVLSGQMIALNTESLHQLGSRLEAVSNRIRRVDDCFNRIKASEELELKLINIRKLGQMNENSLSRVKYCSNYLHHAADVFEKCENRIIAAAERING
ncbi:Mbeg1-like protein [Acetobacterium wieringae]|uniref:Mbeg1-like protein n=1 Tax=Acetobacterium wieringae TaxID=52694 RepID=UPI0031587B09